MTLDNLILKPIVNTLNVKILNSFCFFFTYFRDLERMSTLANSISHFPTGFSHV